MRSCGKTHWNFNKYYRQIGTLINRSQCIVKNCLKLGAKNYGKIKRSRLLTRFSNTVKCLKSSKRNLENCSFMITKWWLHLIFKLVHNLVKYFNVILVWWKNSLHSRRNWNTENISGTGIKKMAYHCQIKICRNIYSKREYLVANCLPWWNKAKKLKW